MSKSVTTIVSDVRVCLDEIGLNDASLISGSDNAEMNSIIESKIEDAISYVYRNADETLVLLGDIDREEYTSGGYGETSSPYTFGLPADTLRVLYVVMLENSSTTTIKEKVVGVPIHHIIYSNEKEYATLFNPITTGHDDNPKVGVDLAQLTFSLYGPTLGGGKRVELGYLGMPTKSNSAYNISESLYRAVVYYIAGLVAMTYKDAHADSLFNMAISSMGVKIN